jgi:D-alanyl-lipoteichoic acid acyltransferase DltB (MBOAT superfamily)
MTFVTSQFAIFLIIFVILWLLTRGHYELRVGVMLWGSLIFYGYEHWWFVPIILGYSVVDWGTALWLGRTSHRKLILALGIGFNLFVLAFWKYTPLLMITAAELFGWPQPAFAADVADGWIIPMGISFYSFIGIAYMVDVYRGTIPAERDLWRYSLFASFFPHLVAGPILRAKEFLWHLEKDRLPNKPLAPWEGTFLIGRGFFKKLVLADGIAVVIDPFFAHVTDASTDGVWALPYVYLYALQIYFDFSGYTDIARGLGLWFGFRWPENFNWPYLATSVQDFWRRWHMTLSRFLRDYLYIPLGGSRHGHLRATFALIVTMLLGGLWHGASWSFMLWGGLHGVFLVINRLWGGTALSERLAALGGIGGYAWHIVRIVLTFHAVCFAWSFFRLTHLDESIACVKKWVVFDSDKLLAGGSDNFALWLMLAAYGLATLAATLATRGAPLPEVGRQFTERPMLRGAAWGGSLSLVILAWSLSPGGQTTPFIYFQF